MGDSYIILLYCLCGFSAVCASNFNLSPEQQCYYFGCSWAGGFIEANAALLNWNDYSDFEQQPDGKMKLVIPYVVRAYKKGRKRPNWQWVRKARKYIEQAKALFEDTNVSFVEYRVL